MHRVAVLLLALGCAETPSDLAAADPEAASRVGQPITLSVVGAPTPGGAMTLTVDGLDPGETATVMVSVVGTGLGPCPASLGGACLDLLRPATLGRATADALGDATLTVTAPSNLLPGSTIWLQAVWVDANPEVSPPVSATVATPCVGRPSEPATSLAPLGGTFAPHSASVFAYAIADDAGLHDYRLSAGHRTITTSGAIGFQLHDELGALLCTVGYDASDSVAVPPSSWTVPAGRLGKAYVVTPLGDGYTDCPSLDPALYGTDDVRDLFRDPIGLGIGSRVAPGDGYGAYVSFDLVHAEEIGAAYGNGLVDCATVDTAQAGLTTFTVAPPNAFYRWVGEVRWPL